MTVVRNENGREFGLAMAKHLRLNPAQISEQGFTATWGLAPYVEVRWEGVARMTLKEFSEVLTEAGVEHEVQ